MFRTVKECACSAGGMSCALRVSGRGGEMDYGLAGDAPQVTDKLR